MCVAVGAVLGSYFCFDLADPGVKACCHGGPCSWEHQRAEQIRKSYSSQPGNSHIIDSDLYRSQYQLRPLQDKLTQSLKHGHHTVAPSGLETLICCFQLKRVHLKSDSLFSAKRFIAVMSHTPAYPQAFFFFFFALQKLQKLSFVFESGGHAPQVNTVFGQIGFENTFLCFGFVH